jgi:hypothetical protein
MSLIRADIPTIVIGMKDIGFANAGINSYNTYKIIKIADPFESYNPSDPINAITGFEKDAAYFFFAKETIDLTGIADNAVPVNLDTTSGNNVFANMAFAGVAKTTASFATVGFNTSNLLWIYKVSDPYESYNPNDPYNPIDGFEVNECYYGYALADMDLNAYLIPPIVIKDDVEKATDTYKYWGTEATTDKDFYNVPVRFFADEASLPTTGIENIVYVAKAEKTSWYWDGSAYQQIGGGTGTSYTFSDSLNEVAGTVNLDGDSATPGNSKYYGTDGTGSKGFYSLPTYTDTNIYNTDGTLAGNRTITGNNKYLALTGGRWEEAKGADVASANNLTLGNDGNTFKITGNTQINAITTANWQAGSRIYLIFASTPIVKHNTTGGAGTAVIILAGGVDYTAAANDILSLIYDGTSWHEVGRKLAATGNLNIYNSNGTLTSERTVDVGTLYRVTFSGSNSVVAGSTIGILRAVNNSTGFGLYAFSTGGIAGMLDSYNASTNSIATGLRLNRSTTGGGANGIGIAFDFTLPVNTPTVSQVLAAKIAAYWKDAASSTKTSALRNQVVYNALDVVTEDICGGRVQTTGNTPTVMATATIDDESCGIIEVFIVARHSTTSGMVVGKKIFSYIKDGGTLTLGTQTTVLADEITGSCVGSSYSISAVSNQLSISVTGVAATTINWKATIKIIPST